MSMRNHGIAVLLCCVGMVASHFITANVSMLTVWWGLGMLLFIVSVIALVWVLISAIKLSLGR